MIGIKETTTSRRRLVAERASRNRPHPSLRGTREASAAGRPQAPPLLDVDARGDGGDHAVCVGTSVVEDGLAARRARRGRSHFRSSSAATAAAAAAHLAAVD